MEKARAEYGGRKRAPKKAKQKKNSKRTKIMMAGSRGAENQVIFI